MQCDMMRKIYVFEVEMKNLISFFYPLERMETANFRSDEGAIQFNNCWKSKKWSVSADVRKIASCGRIRVILAPNNCTDSCHHPVSKCWRSVWFQPAWFVVVQVFATGCN